MPDQEKLHAMSLYEEMRGAALAANKDWNDYRDRSGQCFQKFIFGFVEACGIPSDKVSYMAWDEDEQVYAGPEPGKRFSLSGAMKFKEDEQCWCIGLSITLSPAQWVAFAWTLEEKDGHWLVKVAGDKIARPIDPQDPNQCSQLYHDIVARIVSGYKTKKPNTGTIVLGFGAA